MTFPRNPSSMSSSDEILFMAAKEGLVDLMCKIINMDNNLFLSDEHGKNVIFYAHRANPEGTKALVKNLYINSEGIVQCSLEPRSQDTNNSDEKDNDNK